LGCRVANLARTAEQPANSLLKFDDAEVNKDKNKDKKLELASESESELAFKGITNSANLVSQVSQEEERQVRQGLLDLDKFGHNVAQALQECDKTLQIADAWWAQPGQFVVPWITLDGLDVLKWLQRLKALTTELRQLEGV